MLAEPIFMGGHMCEKCEILHLHDCFRSPAQYFHEIDKIRSLISRGDMFVCDQTMDIEAVTGDISCYVRHVVECKCKTRFAISYEKSRNEGSLVIF